jgi:ferrous iron transport protein B
MHPFWGIPILLVILFLLYEFVGVLGAGTLVGFFENTVFGQYINPFASQLSERFIPIVWLRDFFTGPYGLITMALAYGFAIILPIVATFFLAFGIMEDSGYLPRLAVMVNRLFRLVGLNGKAVLPLVLGLGCDTMATMVTRILPTNKERILVTLLLALGVPCSAQLGVIMGLLSGMSLMALFWWLGILVIVMFITAYFANKVISGVCSDFMMEIPPMRMPEIGNILAKTYARVKWYLKEVIPIFILGTAVLFGLDQTGALAYIEKLFAPVVTGLMGLPKDVTAAFLIVFFRRDYGAAGLYDLAQKGLLNPQQIVVSLVTITLFVPCFAQFLMMVKERGWKVALLIVAFIFPLAILVGSAVNMILNLIGGL